MEGEEEEEGGEGEEKEVKEGKERLRLKLFQHSVLPRFCKCICS